MENFGTYIRQKRKEKQLFDKSFSLRQTAERIQVEPSYLSKVERGVEPTPSEQFVKKIAKELSLDENISLAMVGKISQELKDIILKNPTVFAELLYAVKNYPEKSILRIAREVKDGNW